ncbi:hypothetical protein [Acinetobacter baumannii]|uniref:hypothetical protein n=1 Tax=Acinetobacter baumannii TaxID=470 RepID=UPI00313D12C2
MAFAFMFCLYGREMNFSRIIFRPRPSWKFWQPVMVGGTFIWWGQHIIRDILDRFFSAYKYGLGAEMRSQRFSLTKCFSPAPAILPFFDPEFWCVLFANYFRQPAVSGIGL